MSIRALLQALGSSEWSRVREAVEQAAERLRARDLDDDERAEISRALAERVRHGKWEVRKEVALALRYLPDEVFNANIGLLLEDEHPLVQRAAQRTLSLRRERSQMELLPGSGDEEMTKALAKLRPASREAAVRVGAQYTEFIVRALYHEVITAMMPVGITLQTLEELANETTAPYARAARDQLRQVRAVLERARDFVTTTTPDFRPTRLRSVVERALEKAGACPIALANGLEASVDVDGALEIAADETRLAQAVANVIKNAVEASKEQKPIPLRVVAKRDKGRVLLVVTDQGCGMTKQEFTHDIWRPFGSQKPGGTGLGMPLVKKIIETEHRGGIAIESEKGKGTKVILSLPIHQES